MQPVQRTVRFKVQPSGFAMNPITSDGFKCLIIIPHHIRNCKPFFNNFSGAEPALPERGAEPARAERVSRYTTFRSGYSLNIFTPAGRIQ